MIVRLKADHAEAGSSAEEGFQFYDSPIKRALEDTKAVAAEGFNSMIVRLKGRCGQYARHRGRSFNSMIVRLKVCKHKIYELSNQFQFYDSPIKRLEYFFKNNCSLEFQFYDSPIKRHRRCG